MSLPYCIAIRVADYLIEEIEVRANFNYDGAGRFIPGACYLEIRARYESLSLMEEFSTPDVICKDYDGDHFYFLIED